VRGLDCSVSIATRLRTVGKEEGVSISGRARDVSSHLRSTLSCTGCRCCCARVVVKLNSQLVPSLRMHSLTAPLFHASSLSDG